MWRCSSKVGLSVFFFLRIIAKPARPYDCRRISLLTLNPQYRTKNVAPGSTGNAFGEEAMAYFENMTHFDQYRLNLPTKAF